MTGSFSSLLLLGSWHCTQGKNHPQYTLSKQLKQVVDKIWISVETNLRNENTRDESYDEAKSYYVTVLTGHTMNLTALHDLHDITSLLLHVRIGTIDESFIPQEVWEFCIHIRFFSQLFPSLKLCTD